MSTAPARRTVPPSPEASNVVHLRHRGGDGAATSLTSLAPLGMWLALVPIGMLFVAFASAYVVRSGLGSDWTPVRLPGLIWLNTIVLLGSSATLEIARRRAKLRRPEALWVWTTFFLGVGFLAGQLAAWAQLTGTGIGLGTTPYGSFFYLLTGTHAVHLLVGIGALLAAAVWPQEGWGKLSRPGAIGVRAIGAKLPIFDPTASMIALELFKEAGFRWGGEIEGQQKDFMHFSPSGY